MKKFTILLSLLITVAFAHGQNFSTFGIEGALSMGSIRNTTPGTVEVVVPQDFDVTKCKISFTLGATLAFDPNFTVLQDNSVIDLSSPVTVKLVDSATGTSREVVITVKKINPATTLPLDVAFSSTNTSEPWDNTVVGWADSGLDPRKNTVARFGTSQVSFIVAFAPLTATAGNVTYNLWAVGTAFDADAAKPGCDFRVYASADGNNWRELAVHTSSVAPLSTDNSIAYTHNLQAGDKYVKWVYVNRDGINVNANNFKVSEGVATGIFDKNLYGLEVYPNPTVDFLNIKSDVEVEFVSVFSFTGKEVMKVPAPVSKIDVNSLQKGMYLLQINFADGATYTSKLIKK